MPTSPARLAANQRNALKSTGPKTPEGKAASRCNAFRHGMAGEGTLLAPGEDPKRVEARSKAFAAELGAEGEVGELLAHRAALLSIRMEQAAEREINAVAANKQAARDQFDQDRFDELEHWIKSLDDPETLPSALEILETTPEGLAHLIATWGERLDAIRSDDGFASNQATKQATDWLGWGDDEAEALEAGQTGPIEAEITRLKTQAAAMTPIARAIEARRDRAAILASFDPSPAATLARRYEAAAERGMYRAIRAIAEFRRGKQIDLAPLLRDTPPRPSAAPTPRPDTTPLGSFRAEVFTPLAPPATSPPTPIEPPISDAERRKKRPDLRKLTQKRR